MTEEEHRIKAEKGIERIANLLSYRQIIFRAMVSGIFTAIGATFGFALLIFLLGVIYTYTSDIPLIDRIYEILEIPKPLD